MAKTNIFESNWVDLVFTDKNKEYGAFVLRKKNNHYTVIAILLAITAFGLVISAPVIINYIKGVMPEKTKEVVIQEVAVLEEPPPVDEKEPPPPPAPPPPPLKQTIQYTPPVIKKDEEVKDDEIPPTQEDVKDETVYTKTDSGSKDGIDPSLLEKPPGEDLTGGGNGEEVVTYAQQMPEFPGGEGALLDYIRSHFNYPPIAVENQIQGTVKVSFIVEKDGSVSNVTTVNKPLGDGIEEEAIRVVKTLPKFTPAKQNGNPVRLSMVVPIKLKLK